MEKADFKVVQCVFNMPEYGKAYVAVRSLLRQGTAILRQGTVELTFGYGHRSVVELAGEGRKINGIE
jgi:hypothetical protein